jgi:hypothetical protein
MAVKRFLAMNTQFGMEIEEGRENSHPYSAIKHVRQGCEGIGPGLTYR